MYPPRFEYAAPTSLDEALGALAQLGDDAKILAGGQSLIPMMKLRFAAPETLVDVKNLPGLDGISANGHVEIGALATHTRLATDPTIAELLPAMSAAGKVIADPLVRNLGTIGGSLAHADPQADWGSVLLATGAELVLQKKGGERTVPIGDFFQGIFTTALEPDEMITAIRVSKPAGKHGGAYLKMERKVGDFATAAAAIHVELDGSGKIAKAGIGLTAVGPMNLKADQAEQALVGQIPSPELYAEAGRLAADKAEPNSDNRGSAEYKKNVIKVFVERGLARAVAQAQG